MTHLEFLAYRFGGSNWVLARRSPAILRRYGEDVVCVSRQRCAAVEKEYRALYGDPYDKVRAQMYMALHSALDVLPGAAINTRRAITEAIEAEQNAK
jgi:hypothetical protein